MIDQSRLSGGFVKKCNYSPKAGVIRKWFFNYEDLDRIASKLSHKNTCVDELVLSKDAKIYPVYATKKASSNHQLITSDGGNFYKHSDTLVIIHRDKYSREYVQELVNGGRICVIIERVDENSKYELLGYHSGMAITSDDYNTHENNATSTIIVSTPESEEESTAIKLLNINELWIKNHLLIGEFTQEFTLEFT